MDEDTMSTQETAILAAQARANIRRLLEFNIYDGVDADAFARVDRLLKGMADAK